MDKLDELKKHIAQASELLLESADPFDRACTIISELKAELDKLEQDAKPEHWPQVGDKYLTVDYDGQTVLSVWEDAEFDHYRLATGNCHRTEAEALAYRDWQTDPRVVARGMIERMESLPVFGRYSIYARSHDLYVQVEEENDQWTDGGLRFESEKQASEAMTKLGKPLIKVALGVITDKEEAGRIVREAMGE